jgi:thiosulfate dehydrogenase (quinone) large subunit
MAMVRPDARRPATRLDRLVVVGLRVAAGLLWITNLGWKVPPRFGEGIPDDAPADLYQWTSSAVDYPFLPPYSWVVEHWILPNFTLFAWGVVAAEAAVGIFLILGLATRFWAVIGAAQSLVIMFTVANAPHEWLWAYVLMILLHAAIFATAAGRYAGLDAVLRPAWQRSGSRAARLLGVAS